MFHQAKHLFLATLFEEKIFVVGILALGVEIPSMLLFTLKHNEFRSTFVLAILFLRFVFCYDSRFKCGDAQHVFIHVVTC